MSSGFVSSGQLDASDSTEKPNTYDDTEGTQEPTGVDAWAAADAAVKAAKEKAASSGLVGSQEGGKSLYEVLQANKARKQEAFEEKLKFKNQFRSLDDGEVEFLDSIISEQRAEEEAKKKELESQLDDFRKLQYEADHDPNAVNPSLTEGSGNTWAVSARRKRKKDKENPIAANLKLRKMSDGTRKESALPVDDSTKASDKATNDEAPDPVLKPITTTNDISLLQSNSNIEKGNIKTPATAKQSGCLGGLVAYGSDSDED
ncbi:hypothetical protein H072_2016 [Dactylellina haptotyla CBS 200.50]|uniref:FAM192A/Fyv6 N-terminal domain-containing protein n=1 Tax=Dactylellina haptotyla (strain CBS 200.50) TaxID=1284197 RepID=S8C8M7_DACHA|nr:hypothetical protein H072_2016 [Dactylellina haptotyla CBS 200.50]